MSLILNIDTSSETASICLAEEGRELCLLMNHNQKEHAAWLHPAIQEALVVSGKELRQLDAVALTAGPGSYTGLRVGMAAAKGLCYALQVPMIAINTLEAMAFAVKETQTAFLAPMIDARRMEVFTAVYDRDMTSHLSPCALILTDLSYVEFLDKGTVLFFGSGSGKWKTISKSSNAYFTDISFNASTVAELANRAFKRAEFSPIAYAEPTYIKGIYVASGDKSF